MLGYYCNLGSLKREWTLRRFWRFGERIAWYVLKHMWNQSKDVRAGDVTNQEAIKPAQTKLSLA